jgi:hypothetical protein
MSRSWPTTFVLVLGKQRGIKMFSVITEYKGWSQSAPVVMTRQFSSREQALDWIADEMFQSDTLRVRCPQMDIEEVGELA